MSSPENYVTLNANGIQGNIYNKFPNHKLEFVYQSKDGKVIQLNKNHGSLEKYGGTMSLTASIRSGCCGCEDRIYSNIPGV